LTRRRTRAHLFLLAAGLLPCAAALGQADAPAPLKSLRSLPTQRGDDARLPITVKAQEIRARPDLEVVAEGDAELQRGGVAIRADRLTYELADDLAVARGQVRITHQGAVFTGPELQLRVQRFEGFFEHPSYEFTRTGAGGSAERIDFIDASRATARAATYTSCPRDGSGDPAWLLSTDALHLDFESNEGVAEGAVLRFLGVPILAAPGLSFPISDQRKSGWLPPTVTLDSRSGLVVSVPYYWNIAPNRDATVVPKLFSRRGAGVGGEFRYLEPGFNGRVQLDLLPDDRQTGTSRRGLQFNHEGLVGPGIRYGADLVRVSDDEYWKDFPGSYPDLVPRLLPLRAFAERPFSADGASGLVYARVMQWQVQQSLVAGEQITSPYNRAAQAGARASGGLPLAAFGGLEYAVETEYNQFTLPNNDYDAGTPRLTGSRLHAVGSLSRPWRQPGWWVTPTLALNAASYTTDQPMSDGRTTASRLIPTFSLDAGAVFERPAQAFGRDLRQTLEPRVLYANTPYRAQSLLPAFDAWGRDFNFVSIYQANNFAGVDRVSDSHQITAGVSTRLLDSQTGAEALRLGLAQRYLLRDQLVTAQSNGAPDGAPLSQRFSDFLLAGSTSLVPKWTLDAALQYSPELSRLQQSMLGARYTPGAFRTVNAAYRLTRGVSEQVDVGWQWPMTPVRGNTPAAQAARDGGARADAAPADGRGTCSGTWFSVGRLSYSLYDQRLTDALVGFEYDAGCWIGRVVAQRLSTGSTEATSRLMLQLELVGLSRLGSNPLQVLKDNIPGYRLLRERNGDSLSPSSYD